MKKFNINILLLLILPITLLPGCTLLNWLQRTFTASPRIPNTYDGRAITAASIYPLMTAQSPLSSQDQITLNEWLKKPKNKNVLEQLLQFHFETPEELSEKAKRDNKALRSAGLRNQSRSNYVFRVPGLDYYIKIAGPMNRAQSTLMELGIWPGQKANVEQFNQVLAGSIPTYQTASRAAYYLALKQLINSKNLNTIGLQKTHLMHYPASAKSSDDNYALVLEKALPKNVKKLTAQNIKTIPNESLTDLVNAIIGVGLWSIKDNVFMDTNGKLLYLVDLEQPNNSAPKDFFLKDPVRYYGNINAGLEELLALMKGDPKRLDFVRQLIESNPVVQSPHYHDRYKKELMKALQQ